MRPRPEWDNDNVAPWLKGRWSRKKAKIIEFRELQEKEDTWNQDSGSGG